MKDLTLRKDHLKNSAGSWLNASSTGAKDVTRQLNKLMTLQAPLQLSREEIASSF